MHIQVHIVIQTNTGIYIQHSYIHTYMYRYEYIWIVELHMHIQTYTDVYMHIWTIYTHTDIWTIYAFQCKCICACILLVYTCTIHAYMNQRIHMSTYEPAGSLMDAGWAGRELRRGMCWKRQVGCAGAGLRRWSWLGLARSSCVAQRGRRGVRHGAAGGL